MGWLAFYDQFLSGLNLASILFLIAAGFALVWGVLHIINFAHGSFYLIGAYMTYTLVQVFGDSGFAFFLALIFGPIAVALVSAVVEVFLFRRIYDAHMLYQFVMTFGLVYIFSDLMRLTWGQHPYSLKRPSFLSSSISFTGAKFPSYFLFTLVIACAAGLLLWIILHKTKFGKIVRAVHQDTEMAGALGINVPRVRTAVFVIGSYLAGLGGAVAAGSQAIFPGIDAEVTIVAFIVIIIGGPGGLGGPLVGALLVGLVEAFGIMVLPQFAVVFMYFVVVIVLLVRPWGLVGKESLN
jgi:branched-subunit amino acid ABC-type transport system permease component